MKWDNSQKYSVCYDKRSLSAITCLELFENRNDKKIKYQMTIGYTGKAADEFKRILTEQGYLKELLEKAKGRR